MSDASSDPSPVAPDAADESAVTIDTVASVDDELLAAFERLIPQLSSSSPPPSRQQLAALVDNRETVLFVARGIGSEGTTEGIIGSLTLAFYRIPTGLKAWIEDVVVDEAARGRGVGAALTNAALAEARTRGSKDVSLTSRPAKEAANRLYQRIGFEARETNVYRYKF